MNIPRLRPVTTICDGSVKTKALVANFKNSDVPGLATRHLEAGDPDIEIELAFTGMDGDGLTEWQTDQLTELFEENGIVPGLGTAIKAYEASTDFSGYEPDASAQMDELGLLPWVYVWNVICDEKTRIVYVSANTDLDENIHEHALYFMRKGSVWILPHEIEVGKFLATIGNR